MPFTARSCGSLRILWVRLAASTPGEFISDYIITLMACCGLDSSGSATRKSWQNRELGACPGVGGVAAAQRPLAGAVGALALQSSESACCSPVFTFQERASVDVGCPGEGMVLGEVALCSCGHSQREGLPTAASATGTPVLPSLKGDSRGAHSTHRIVVITLSLLICELLENNGASSGTDRCCHILNSNLFGKALNGHVPTGQMTTF